MSKFLLLAFSIAYSTTTQAGDADWQTFGHQIESADYPAAAALIQSRRTVDANDPQAFLMQVTLEQNQFRGEPRPDLVKELKACVKAQPEAFDCHLGLAEMLGLEASRAGMLKAMTLVDDVREHFLRAVELDPRDLRARNGLQSFYEGAPAMVGGGRDKADAHQAEYARLEPQLAPLLRINRLIRDQQLDAAAQILRTVPEDAPFMQRSIQLSGLISLAFNHIGARHYDEAEPLLQLAASRFPASPYPQLGLGRVQLERGDAQAAVLLLEKALQIDPRCGAQYRLGLAYEKLERKDDAIAQYQAFLKLEGRVGKDVLKEAKARLKALRG